MTFFDLGKIRIGIELHQFILVHKRYINRQMLVDEIDLLQRQLARRHIQFLLRPCRIAILAEQGLQVGGKLRMGCRPWGTGCGRMVYTEEGKADLPVA